MCPHYILRDGHKCTVCNVASMIYFVIAKTPIQGKHDEVFYPYQSVVIILTFMSVYIDIHAYGVFIMT